MYNVVFVSGVQQSDSDMYVLLQDTEYSSLCFLVITVIHLFYV